MALQTAISAAYDVIIWWTLFNKRRRKIGFEFGKVGRPLRCAVHYHSSVCGVLSWAEERLFSTKELVSKSNRQRPNFRFQFRFRSRRNPTTNTGNWISATIRPTQHRMIRILTPGTPRVRGGTNLCWRTPTSARKKSGKNEKDRKGYLIRYVVTVSRL